MAQTMTGQLREDITRHVTEIYFPEELNERIWETIPQIWSEYLDTTIGKPPAGVRIPEVNIYLTTRNPKIERFMKDKWNRNTFKGRRAFFPFCSPTEHSSGTALELDLDNCPIAQLRDTITALADIHSEKRAFKTALNSELLKTPSVEAFLKKFPEMKGAMAPWIKDSIVDLPVECTINMEKIAFEAV